MGGWIDGGRVLERMRWRGTYCVVVVGIKKAREGERAAACVVNNSGEGGRGATERHEVIDRLLI